MNALDRHFSPAMWQRSRLSICIGIFALVGCARTEEPAPPSSEARSAPIEISGRVTVDGAAAANVRVQLMPIGDGDQPAAASTLVARTDESGRFAASAPAVDDHDAPREFKVLLSWLQPEEPDATTSRDKFKGRYSDFETSPFLVTIPAQSMGSPIDVGTIEATLNEPTVESATALERPVAADNSAAHKTTSFPAPPPPSEESVPLNPQKSVFLDAARKRVYLKATVVLREGVLEMFACKTGSKEHESVVSVDTEAYVIHAALLAAGAEPGRPVQFEPEYSPPQGQVIDVFVNWTDETGRPRREPAQTWIRHVTRRYYIEPLEKLPDDLTLPEDSELRYDEKRKELIWFGPMTDSQRDELLALSADAGFQSIIRKIFEDGQSRQMEADFVFAGSGFYEEEDGTRYYLAESGNLICVANFTDAILDVAMQSLSANDALLFEPFTERIPEVGTEVTIELVPRQPGE